MDEEAQRLSVLVTDAIQMARIEAGRTELHREDTLPDVFVEEVLDKMYTPLDGRVVQTNFPPGLPPVSVDRELLELALRNVIDNAIKYSQPNAPLAVSAAAEEGRVVVSVKDRGEGIPEADLHHLFDRFLPLQELARAYSRRRTWARDRTRDRAVPRGRDVGGEQAARRRDVPFLAAVGVAAGSAGCIEPEGNGMSAGAAC